MQSPRAIGLQFQRWVKDWLETRGWTIYNKGIGARYEKKRDIFGCDLIAKHPNFIATVWIQATAKASASLTEKTKPLIEIPWSFPVADRVFIFIKRKPRKVDVYEFKGKDEVVKIGHIDNRIWYSIAGTKFKWDR